MIKDNVLHSILDDEFLVTLAKSAELYKVGSNTVLDPQEILIGLKVVPRAVMSLLISELVPMEVGGHKDIKLPFGKDAFIRVNKHTADNYTGSIYNENKLAYDFKNRSIPGLGVILLSTFELYDLEHLKDESIKPEVEQNVQKLIDERMELHSLVGRVVENKISEREAIHKMMMDKLNEVMKPHSTPEPGNITPNEGNPHLIDGPAVTRHLGPLHINAEDVMKKESIAKKGSPLKDFLDRKKSKEYRVEMTKSEEINCSDCGQLVYGSGFVSACICYGSDQHKKIWLKKSKDGIQIRFSKSWDFENISMLLETLRGSK